MKGVDKNRALLLCKKIPTVPLKRLKNTQKCGIVLG